MRVAVIGAGMSGLLAAIELRRAGHDPVVFEKADRLGGTWRDNTYPGLSCDVPAHSYTYSFARNPDWSQHYATGPEIQGYFERVAREQGDQGQQRDDGKILQQQHRERVAAYHGSQLATLCQYLKAECRRRQCETKAHDHCSCKRQTKQQGQPGKGEPGQYHLGGAETEHHAPHDPQPGRFQFDTDDEKQEDNTEFGDMPDLLHLVNEAEHPGTHDDAGREVTQDRTETELLEDRHGNNGRAEEHEYVNQIMGFRHGLTTVSLAGGELGNHSN